MTNAEPKGRGLKWKGLTKTEYGYKRRCGGKDRRGVQEKTAARSADARDQWTRLDTGKANEKTEYGYKRAARAKSEAVGAAGVGGESSFRSKICSNC